jgi:guanylate kinase
MDVDVQGAKKLKALFAFAVGIFILPPHEDSLRHRFIARGITDHADLNRRLESAQVEIGQAGNFDFTLINDDFEHAYGQFRKIVEQLVNSQ